MLRKFLAVASLIFVFNQSVYSQDIIKIDDFIIEHSGFEENEVGEITPINIKEINKKIRFFVEEKYPEIVEYTRNIIWDSYTTFLSPSDRYHYHTFIAQVKVNDIDRLKYVEVNFNPFNDEVLGDYEWIEDDEEFYLSGDMEEDQKKKPDLIDLGIGNLEQKATLDYFISEHQGFLDVMETKNLKEGEIIPLNVVEINKTIRSFVKANYNNVVEWAASNLPDNQIDAFDSVVDSGNPAAINIAFQGLQSKYNEANGYEGRMLQGKPAGNSGQLFRSQAELVAAMGDPRYDNDPAYRQDVISKLEQSDLNF